MIIKEMTGSYFYDWLMSSELYKKNFTYEGSNAIQEYMEEISEETGENINFDPIAWCCEFAEYEDLEELKKYYNDIKTMEDLEEKTTVILISPLIIVEF